MKNTKIRIAVYIMVFVATAVLTYIFAIDKVALKKSTTTLTSAGLPVVYMTSESGIKYNYLHGYTGGVNQELIHGAVTPIGSDRVMKLSIRQYGCTVSGISYELRNLVDETLVERTTAADYQARNDVIDTSFEFKNLLETGQEYMLKVIVSSEEYGDISYYTRIVIMDNASVDTKLKYVMNFAKSTFADETLKDIMAKLEIDSTGDNTNLGRVNIHCKLSQVGFGKLSPTLSSDMYVTINEISGKTASLATEYMITTADDDNSYSYNVKEAYRINEADATVTYVYNFDRWMDQVFNPDNGISSGKEIYLGIASDQDVEMKNSSNGSITCFVNNNTLWSYNASKDRFIQIFSFAEDGTDGIRENYDASDIEILSVKDKGDVEFLVYGYMNRGPHEGKLGVSVCSYSYENNLAEELVFIPMSQTKEIIGDNINALAYINESNILYFYYDNSIYYLDYATKECMLVANNVIEQSCIMSDTSKLLMYQCGEDFYNNSVINVLNLESGGIFEVKAEDNDRIQALGFIDGNIVYGLAHSDMIGISEDGSAVYPMYKLVVADSSFEAIKEYSADGIYIVGAEFDESKISMKRVSIDENGALVPASDDQMLSNEENTTKNIKLVQRTSDTRQKENYISLVKCGSTDKYNSSSAKYKYVSDSVVNIINESTTETKLYYVYGYGGLYSFNTSLGNAIAAANDIGGVVVDAKGVTIWTRYKDKSHTIKLSEELFTASDDTRAAATAALLTYAGIEEDASADEHYINLTGCRIDQALYYVNKNSPLMVKTGEGIYELVYAYSDKDVTVIDFTTGAAKIYSKTELDSLAAAYGNIIMIVDN